METDIGNPIDYTPDIMDESDKKEPSEIDREEPPYYYYPPPQAPMQPQYQEKIDIFSNLDKTAYIVIFVAFILGFFMGKTMQPVILRPGWYSLKVGSWDGVILSKISSAHNEWILRYGVGELRRWYVTRFIFHSLFNFTYFDFFQS